jgi:hypothetical protein
MASELAGLRAQLAAVTADRDRGRDLLAAGCGACDLERRGHHDTATLLAAAVNNLRRLLDFQSEKVCSICGRLYGVGEDICPECHARGFLRDNFPENTAPNAYLTPAPPSHRHDQALFSDGIAQGLSRALVALDARAAELRASTEADWEIAVEAGRCANLVRSLLEALVDP